MSQYWFVKTSGGIAGPFTLAKLGKLTAAGRVKPAVAISMDQENWIQAHRVDGLCFPELLTKKEVRSTEVPATEVPATEVPVQPDPSCRQFDTIREDHYARRFGQCDRVVSGEVNVRVYPANAIRPITTLVTSGLSEHEFKQGKGLVSPRRELVLYVDKYYDAYSKLLQCLARALARSDDRFGYGDVISNKQPAKPIFRGGAVDHFLMMIPNVASDFAIRDAVSIAGQPLHLMWVVPITAAETKMAEGQGMQEFCKLLDRMEHGLTVKPKRSCYIGPPKTSGQQRSQASLTPLGSQRPCTAVQGLDVT